MATTTITAQMLGKLPVRTDVRTLSARHVTSTARKLPRAARRARRDGARRRVADVRERPHRRLHDRRGRAHDRSLDGGGPRQRRRDHRGVGARAFDRVKLRRSRDRGGGRGRARRAPLLAQARASAATGSARTPASPVHDHELVQTAAWLFGGLYIGLQMPLSAQKQVIWDWTGSLAGPARPGSWGGHAVDVVALRPRTGSPSSPGAGCRT